MCMEKHSSVKGTGFFSYYFSHVRNPQWKTFKKGAGELNHTGRLHSGVNWICHKSINNQSLHTQ